MRSDISWVLRTGTSIPRSAIFAHILGPWFHMDPAIRMRLPLRVSPRSGPTLPPWPLTEWHSTQRFFVKSASPSFGFPGGDVHALRPSTGSSGYRRGGRQCRFPGRSGGEPSAAPLPRPLRFPRFQRAAVRKSGDVYRLYLSSRGPTLPPLPPSEWQVWHPFWLKRRAPVAASAGRIQRAEVVEEREQARHLPRLEPGPGNPFFLEDVLHRRGVVPHDPGDLEERDGSGSAGPDRVPRFLPLHGRRDSGGTPSR